MASRGKAEFTAIALIVLLAGGCTSAKSAGASPSLPASLSSASTPAPSASPSPSPTIAAPSIADLTTEVTHAQLPKVTGSHFEAVDRSGAPPLDVCGGMIAAYTQVSVATTWEWLGSGVPTFKEGAFGFEAITGDAVVAQAKALAGSCKSHDSTIGVIVTRIATSGAMALATPSGVDAFYAFCETHKILKPAGLASGLTTTCTAVMSRGHVVVFLTAGGITAAAGKNAIARYLAPTAKALVAAVPAATG